MHGTIKVGDAYELEISGIGDIKLVLHNGTEFMLQNVRHVPQIAKSLISVGQLDDMGYHTTFGAQKWKIVKGFMVVARGPKMDTLYPLVAGKIVVSGDAYVAKLPGFIVA